MKTASARTPTMAVTRRVAWCGSPDFPARARSGAWVGWTLVSAPRTLMIILKLVRNLDSPYNAEPRCVQFSD